jgi:hypothetical protein
LEPALRAIGFDARVVSNTSVGVAFVRVALTPAASGTPSRLLSISIKLFVGIDRLEFLRGISGTDESLKVCSVADNPFGFDVDSCGCGLASVVASGPELRRLAEGRGGPLSISITAGSERIELRRGNSGSEAPCKDCGSDVGSCASCVKACALTTWGSPIS